MSHQQDRIWVATVVFGVVVNPADGLGHVAGDLFHGDLWHEAIVDRNEHETLVHERLRLLLHVEFLAIAPAAAMNPDDDGVPLALGRSVDVENLPVIFGLGVG